MILSMTIMFFLFACIGAYFLIRPNNFFLPYIGFGGEHHAKKYVRTKQHKRHLLIWMRVLGAVLFLISAWFMIDAILA